MFNIPNNNDKNNVVHDQKVQELKNILTSKTYNFNVLEIDKKLAGIRKLMQNTKLPFINAFFSYFKGVPIDFEMTEVLSKIGDLLFQEDVMQKAPDLFIMRHSGLTFLDVKILTDKHPNSFSINYKSYLTYRKFSKNFDSDNLSHMGIVFCGENDSNFKYLPFNHLEQGITPFIVMVYPHTPEETIHFLCEIFGEYRIKMANEVFNKTLEPFIIVDKNQHGIVDLHFYLYSLSEDNHQSIFSQLECSQQQQPFYQQPDFSQQQQPFYQQPDFSQQQQSFYQQPDFSQQQQPFYQQPDFSQQQQPFYQQPDFSQQQQPFYQQPDFSQQQQFYQQPNFTQQQFYQQPGNEHE